MCFFTPELNGFLVYKWHEHTCSVQQTWLRFEGVHAAHLSPLGLNFHLCSFGVRWLFISGFWAEARWEKYTSRSINVLKEIWIQAEISAVSPGYSCCFQGSSWLQTL